MEIFFSFRVSRKNEKVFLFISLNECGSSTTLHCALQKVLDRKEHFYQERKKVFQLDFLEKCIKFVGKYQKR
jgi:hypothetical protein